jgi:hypothetical protein
MRVGCWAPTRATWHYRAVSEEVRIRAMEGGLLSAAVACAKAAGTFSRNRIKYRPQKQWIMSIWRGLAPIVAREQRSRGLSSLALAMD